MPDPELDTLMERFEAKIADSARLQAECAQLTATGTAQRRRVSVTVNADGVPIDITFGSAIADLSYSEIADAITAAAQNACRTVSRRKAELFAPLTGAGRAGAPELDDLLATVDSLRDELS